MAAFYELKKRLHFPRMAGALRVREDAALLHALLVNERAQSAAAFNRTIRILVLRKEDGLAERIAADYRMLDDCYREDIKLLAEYIEAEGISFI